MAVAVPDLETLVAYRGKPGRVQALDDGQGWLFKRQPLQKTSQVRLRAFHLDKDAMGVIDNPSGKCLLDSQSVNKGAEANPLDRAVYLDSQSLRCGHGCPSDSESLLTSC